MNSHLQAALTMTGMMLDALGGLLLAYDLLGGRHGPLRVLLRITVYTILYGLISGLFLGFKFGLIAGIGLGTVLGIELSRKARGHTEFNFKIEAMLGLARMTVIGLATGLTFSHDLGLLIAILGFVLYMIGVKRGTLPTLNYQQSKKLQFDKRNLLFALGRGIGAWVIALLCVIALHGFQKYFGFGMRLGLSIGLSLALLSIFAPMIEWWADQVPERALGVAGAVMFVFGFWLQAAPYVVQLLDIPVS